MAELTLSPRVVVFDFNGTLFDDHHVAYGSVQEISKIYGIPCPTLEQYREEISADYMEFYYNHGLPRTITPVELNTIRNKFYKTNGESAQIRSDVWTTLHHLAYFKIYTAIVSAETETNLFRQLIRANNLQRSFDFIKAESWGHRGKEEALLRVAEIFGEESQRILYIDDSVDGLTSAKNIGMVPIAFTNPTGYHSRHRLMQVTKFNIDEMSEIVKIVKDGGKLP